MGPISADIEIDVSREEAFRAVSDLALRPSFTDHFLTGLHLTRLESRGVGAGARFRVKGPLRSVWTDTAIVEAEEPYRVVEEGLGGRTNRIRTHTVWEITSDAGALTRVRVTRWTEPTPIDRALELLSLGSVWEHRGWKKALRRLRDQLEGERPQGRRFVVAGGNRHPTGIR